MTAFGFKQPFNLPAGEVFAAAVMARRRVSAPVHRFVESLPCPRPLKALPNGARPFRVSTK
jgi:hypothetical protein